MLNHFRLIADKTAEHIERDISKGKRLDNVEYYISSAVRSLKDNGFAPDVEKIINIVLHRDRTIVYWHLEHIRNGGAELRYFYRKSDDEYTLVRSDRYKKLKFGDVSEWCVWEIGNCIVISDNVNKKLVYLSKDRMLFCAYRFKNGYKGYGSFSNIFKNNFDKSA